MRGKSANDAEVEADYSCFSDNQQTHQINNVTTQERRGSQREQQSVYGWGQNKDGQLSVSQSTGQLENVVSKPALVAGLKGANWPI